MMNYFYIPVLLLFLGVSVNAQENSCIGENGKVEWLLFDNVYNNPELYPNYPNTPDGIEIIRKLETDQNFNDNYTSLIRGFIKAPVSGSYQFNITGRDYAQFYLSSGESPDSIIQLVETSWTGYDDFNSSVNQTDTIDLEEGSFYYFEIHHRENTGGEHVRVSWKIPGDIADWRTVGETYIYSYACDSDCNEKGTLCDDGNPETVNDQYDGNCNCIGELNEKPECVGSYGQVQMLFYDNIPGSSINELISHSSYPYHPGRVKTSTSLHLPYQDSHNYFGSSVKAFLKVPVSGTYEVGAVGNTNAEIYLSLTGDMSDVTLVANSNGLTTVLELNADKLYYIKLLHKENEYSEEFAAIWKTPFYGDQWKYIDGAFLYSYGCENACMPEGTPCDDGDSTTVNDAFDANCECVGIYCPNGDCDESTVFAPYETCNTTLFHSTYADDSWISCSIGESMNPKREVAHWIQYDLGSVMPVGASHIWNYNVENETNRGFRDVAIDFSYDGLEWYEWGTMTWPEASGVSEYEGFTGPDFTGISARYLLFTALSTWGETTCAGFSEIQFQVAPCPLAGTPCSDNDENTVNDAYTENCICIGEKLTSDKIEELHNGISIYPNPVSDWLLVAFNVDEPGRVDFLLYDLNGRKVGLWRGEEVLLEGQYQKSIPMQNIQSGEYILEVVIKENTFRESILKL